MSVRISRVESLPPATNDRIGLTYRVGENAYVCLSDGAGGYEWREITFVDDPVVAHDHDADYAPLVHNHDAAYAALVHNHDASYAPLVHTHDDRYYTEAEVTAIVNTVYARIDLGQSDILYPVGFQAGNVTTETSAAVSGITVAQYLGRAPRALTSLVLRANVTTAAATITWAEVAVFTGDYPGAASASLTLAGFTDVAATFNSTGRKNTTIALSGVTAGEEIWLAWGSSATTPFRLRAGLADDLQAGVNQAAAIRPSLAASPQAFISATSEPAWLAALI